MPKVSIIVPVYNTEKYLRKCLDSLIHQTLKDIEIIIVNDGSSDNSQGIINEYAKKDIRVKAYFKENGGQGSARNLGLEKATGEYIGYVDSDDFVELNMYEDMYNKAIEDRSYIVKVGYYITAETGDIVKEQIFAVDTKPTNICQTPEILFDNTAVTNKLFKASLLKNNNIQFRVKKWYEDFDFVIKTICFASNISVIEKPYYYYLQRTGSTMNNSNISRNLEILEAMDEIIDFCKKQGIYDKLAEQLEFLAVQHIYLPTNVRIIRANASWKEKKKVIDKINKYMDEHFKNYKNNKYNSIILTKKKQNILKMIKLKAYWLVWLCFKVQDTFRR